MNLFVDLSGAEFNKKISRCLYLLLLGKTIKEIAYETNLSHRTVEEYFQKVKRSYSCSSKSQIISSLMRNPHNKKSIISFLENV